jgi:hypothetical protein
MMEQHEPLDPATLATSVRELALRARRILNNPPTRLIEVRALSRRIALLQLHVPAGRSSELSRWLESLLDKVKASEQVEDLAAPECRTSTIVAVG